MDLPSTTAPQSDASEALQWIQSEPEAPAANHNQEEPWLRNPGKHLNRAIELPYNKNPYSNLLMGSPTTFPKFPP